MAKSIVKNVFCLMLMLFASVFFSVVAFAEDVGQVQAKTLVNDYAGVINAQSKAQLSQVLQRLYQNNVAQYAVVIVNSLDGRDIESYAFEIANEVLGDKEKNNGLLLLVAVQDKKYRFEVGRGLEAVLNDAKVGRVGRTYLVPNFRDENYEKGILEASLAIESLLVGDTESEYYQAVSAPDTSAGSGGGGFSGFFWLFMLLFILPSMLGGARSYRGKRKKDRYFNAALMAMFMFGGRGGLGGGLGGSGGFGGFGGGGFGGGGAGGGW